jgi:hypothetical protein
VSVLGNIRMRTLSVLCVSLSPSCAGMNIRIFCEKRSQATKISARVLRVLVKNMKLWLQSCKVPYFVPLLLFPYIHGSARALWMLVCMALAVMNELPRKQSTSCRENILHPLANSKVHFKSTFIVSICHVRHM